VQFPEIAVIEKPADHVRRNQLGTERGELDVRTRTLVVDQRQPVKP
jgi:hypothetical protein